MKIRNIIFGLMVSVSCEAIELLPIMKLEVQFGDQVVVCGGKVNYGYDTMSESVVNWTPDIIFNNGFEKNQLQIVCGAHVFNTNKDSK